MSARASSFPAERPARRWYREPWPWLLIAGPSIVVIASLASAWIALRSDDGVVRQDYYKQGLLINRKLAPASAVKRPEPGAVVTLGGDGHVRVRIEGTPERPGTLRLKLAQPAGLERLVILERSPDGEYVGSIPQMSPERWIVTLESDAWRLPTTIFAGRVGEIRLGSATRT